MRIRIRIQQLKLMRIYPDPNTDPDPKPCSRPLFYLFSLLSGFPSNLCPTLQSGKWTFDAEDECWRRLVVSTKEQQSILYPVKLSFLPLVLLPGWVIWK